MSICAFLLLLGLVSGVLCAPKFEIFEDAAGEYRFRARAGNGEIVLHSSEGYTSHGGAVAGVASVRTNAVVDGQFTIEMIASGWKWTLKAGNGQIIGLSEVYSSMAAAQGGIDSILSFIESAPIVDLSESESSQRDLGVFEVYKDAADEFRWRLRASNGEITLHSQGYTTKSAALNGIDSVRTNVNDLTKIDLRDSFNGEFYFVVLAGNGQVIGTSERYSTSAARAVGQYSVERAAPAAPLTDLTVGTAPARTARFTLYRNVAGEIRWRLQAANYRTILHSEGYVSKQGALNGIESVRTNSVMDARFEERESSNGKPFFVLKAGNGQVIGASELFESTAARDNSIASVKSNAPDAVLVDNVLPGKPTARFELFRDAPTGLKWYFRLKAANSEVILVSTKSYESKGDVQAAVAAVRERAVIAAAFTDKTSTNSQFFFTLDAADGGVLGKSELYTRAASRDTGKTSVANNAPIAEEREIEWVAPPTLPPSPAPTPAPTPSPGVPCASYDSCDECRSDVSTASDGPCRWCAPTALAGDADGACRAASAACNEGDALDVVADGTCPTVAPTPAPTVATAEPTGISVQDSLPVVTEDLSASTSTTSSGGADATTGTSAMDEDAAGASHLAVGVSAFLLINIMI